MTRMYEASRGFYRKVGFTVGPFPSVEMFLKS
jgi:hypothetical protein